MEKYKGIKGVCNKNLRGGIAPNIKQFPHEHHSDSMITTPTPPKTPQETNPLMHDKNSKKTKTNSTSISYGSVIPPKPLKYLWRPNNYRRQIKVKTKTNSTIEKIRCAIKCYSSDDFSVNPHTRLVYIKNYAKKQNKVGLTLQYGKNYLTIIYSQNIIAGHKEVFLIEANTMDEIETRINQKKNEIQELMDRNLFDFIKKFEINLPNENPQWSRYEDFIKGEEYIDKIPRETIIHDTFFKKVYGEGIEFKNTKKEETPTIHLKNYIKNRAIEDIAPQIADGLNTNRELIQGILEINASTSKTLNEFVTTFLPIHAEHAVNIRSHTKVIKEMARGFKKFNKLKTKPQKKQSIKKRLYRLKEVESKFFRDIF